MPSSFRLTASIAAALIATAVLSACSEPGEPEGPTSITIAVPSIWGNYDPTNGAHLFAAYNTQAVYDPLWVKDLDSLTYRPLLATEWTIHDDRHSIRMKIRDDVTFSDGLHLDAQVLVDYFDALFASDGFSWKPRIVDTYGTDFSVAGEYEVEITTTASIDYRLFDQLSVTPVVSPAALEDPASLAETPVGSGPYEIVDYVPEVSITLERKDDYWDPDTYPFDTITLKVFTDQVAALNALKTGQIDASLLDVATAAEAAGQGLVIHEGKGQYRTLFIVDREGTKIPALGDARVRQAMNMAFDRATITEQIDRGFGVVSSQPFTNAQAEYIDGRDDEYPFDVEGAKELLAEAGFPDGFDLTIPSSSALASFEPIVQQSLGDIGIRVEFEVFADIEDFYAAITSGEYPVVMEFAYFNNTMPQFLAPAERGDLMAANSPVVDELLTTIREGDPEESAAASQELGTLVLEEAWFVPFSHPATTWASIPSVKVNVSQINGTPSLIDFVLAE